MNSEDEINVFEESEEEEQGTQAADGMKVVNNPEIKFLLCISPEQHQYNCLSSMGIGDGTPTNPPWHSHALLDQRAGIFLIVILTLIIIDLQGEESGSWWKELGQSVPAYRKNQRSHAGEVRENDIDWYDPPVKDGESLANVHGLDTKLTQMAQRRSTSRAIFMTSRRSVQYKQIAEKHEISEEHPGIAVSPSLKTLQHLEPHTLGRLDRSTTISTTLDRDSGTNQSEKVARKRTLLGQIHSDRIYWLDRRAITSLSEFPYHRTYNSRQVMRRYLSNLPLPCALAFTYGSGLCASAQIRHVDDWWNFVAASALSGSLLSAVRGNVVPGVVFGLVTSSFAYFYQHIRSSNAGFGRSTPQETGGPPIATGPFAWKYYYQGSRAEIPERTHY
uniref:Transmembrane protein n=1 Tax=Ditylenchus dipsaci TaxID=166011 RepID=A0A915E0K9_9BILA